MFENVDRSMTVEQIDNSVTARTYVLGSDGVMPFLGFGCCQAHQGLPVGFLLLRYSVLYTVESLSLLYLLFIS